MNHKRKRSIDEDTISNDGNNLFNTLQKMKVTLAKQVQSVIINDKTTVVPNKNSVTEIPTKTFKKKKQDPQQRQKQQQQQQQKSSLKPLSAIAARKAAAAVAAVASDTSTPEAQTPSPTTTSTTTSTTAATTNRHIYTTQKQTNNPPVKSTPLPLPSCTNNNNNKNSTPNMTPASSASNSPSNSVLGIKTFKRREPRFLFKDQNLVSIFEPSKTNVQCITLDVEPCLIIGLKNGEKIVFAGKALVAPLSGSVSIMGSVLHASSTDRTLHLYPAYSPKTHALLAIHSPNTNEISPLIQRTSKLQIPTNDTIQSIVKKMKQSSSGLENIFLVMGMQWCGLDDMEDLAEVPRGIWQLQMPKTDDKEEEEQNPKTLLKSIPGFQPLFSVVPDIKALNISPAWENQVQKAYKTEQERQSPMVGLICGNKDMGKSTFARYLTNVLLNKHKRIAYLETDVGQSEFTPPGVVSLHIIDTPVMGPPYTHQHLSPLHSHYIGSLSSNNNPGHYLDSVSHLIHVYKTQFSTMNFEKDEDRVPLIINTQGWINGLGYDLLLSITQQAEPTNVFIMYSPQLDPIKNLPPTFATTISRSEESQRQGQQEEENPTSSSSSTSLSTPHFHYLECGVDLLAPTAKSFSATSSRELAMVSYLHQDLHTFGCQLGEPWWNFQTRMVDKLPWVLDWRKGLVDGVWFLTEDVPQSQMLHALNGTLVALVGRSSMEDHGGEHEQSPPSNVTEGSSNGQTVPPLYFGPSQNPPPTPSKTKCYGLAVIRAIDPNHHAFHVLTPLPLSLLKKVSSIVKGNIALPVSTLLDQHNGNGNGIARQPWNKVPYLEKSGNVNGIGAIATKKRRIHVRKHT
ncbi:hypothetical protein BDA99DRAFT_17788 [Phascolomyces articulosus]|uniref:Polynucleotide 5'-hydroxyl-kinase GRC3 n=1 Tax=Phascolomyces articulosus TaxID=60185 RepID=A0AAD5KDF7_9FUNG|nr:hypothetical protein BDA99DRAFT_17788 [Phascolomyces articulosus]